MTKPKHDTYHVDKARSLELPESVYGIAIRATMSDDNHLDGCQFAMLGHARNLSSDQEAMTILIARGLLQWLNYEILTDWGAAVGFATKGYAAIETEVKGILAAADDGIADKDSKHLEKCLNRLAATLDRQVFSRKENDDADTA